MLKVKKIKLENPVPVFDITVPKTQSFYANGIVVHNCSEITLPTNSERTAVCCLSSLNAEKYEEWKNTNLVSDLIEMLDNVITGFVETAPEYLSKAAFSASQERSVGLGVMGFHYYLQSKLVPFESQEARKINKEMFEYIQDRAIAASLRLGAERGEAPDMIGTGRRNAHVIAIAPNANSSILLGTSPSIEPSSANAYNHQTRAGSWLVKNRYLESLLETKHMNTEEVWSEIIISKGSVQNLECLDDSEKKVFKTAIELDQMWVIQHAADRQPFICQAQSVNLFFPPNADRPYMNKVHTAAWRKGLKSVYYVRTMTPFMVGSVSKKLTRIALKDGSASDIANVEQAINRSNLTEPVQQKVKQALFESVNNDGCASCEG